MPLKLMLTLKSSKLELHRYASLQWHGIHTKFHINHFLALNLCNADIMTLQTRLFLQYMKSGVRNRKEVCTLQA